MRFTIEQVGLRVVVLVEQRLPLADHAVYGVVQNRDLHRSVVQERGGQLLRGHLEGTVTIDQPHRLLAFELAGRAHGCADGGWQTVAHRAEASGGDPSVLVLEIDELRSPHLVLSHTGHPDGGRIGHLREFFEDPLRGQRAVGRLIPRHRVFLAPAVDRLPPGGQIRLALNGLRVLNLGNQVVEHGSHIAHDRHVGLTVLADFSRVDVNVNHAGGRCEGVELAGHAVVETCTDGHKQVSALHGAGCGNRTVHAQHAEVLRVGVGNDAACGQGRDHGSAGQVGQSLDLCAGVGAGGAATHIQHRAVRLREQLRRVGQHMAVRLGGGVVAGQNHALRP